MEPTPEAVKKTITLSVPVSILIAGAFIGICVIVSGFISGNTAAGGRSGAAEVQKVDVRNVDITTAPYVGKAEAPALVYFSDFQCPYCKQFDQKILPLLKAKYADTGKLKIVFKDFVFLGPDSYTAALFSKAVWNLYPEQYYAWREAMMEAQDAENDGFGDRASIEKLTAGVSGIDQKKVSATVDANADVYKKEITADSDETHKFGISGTPSVIVGTQIVGGFDSIEKYEKAIEASL